MKARLLNLLIIVTSLFGYLEWGGNNSSFLFQAEYEILRNPLSGHARDVIHPFSLIPLFGQALLVATLFQKSPSKSLTFSGIACIGLLLTFIFFIGVIGPNFRMLLSTLPFLVLSSLVVVAKVLTKKKVPS